MGGKRVGKDFKPITKEAIIELYNAGLNIPQIANELGLSFDEVREFLPSQCPTINENEKKEAVLAEVIDGESKITKKAMDAVLDEKRRFQKYALVEDRALDIMIKLLDFYDNVEHGDLDIDRFKATLASSLIRATQLSREELLKRYKMETIKEQNKIKVQFISKGEHVKPKQNNE